MSYSGIGFAPYESSSGTVVLTTASADRKLVSVVVSNSYSTSFMTFFGLLSLICLLILIYMSYYIFKYYTTVHEPVIDIDAHQEL
jgi:hypothetical protein